MKENIDRFVSWIKKYKFIREILFIVFTYIFYKKTMLFMKTTEIAGLFKEDNSLVIPYLVVIAIIVLPFLIFKGRKQFIYLITIDIVYTLFLVINIIYLRETGDMLRLSNFIFPYMYKPMSEVIWTFGFKEIMYFIDIPVLIILLKKVNIFNNSNRNIIIALLGILSCIILIPNYQDSKDFMSYSYNTKESIMYSSPLGYEYMDIENTIKALRSKATEEEISKVESWMEWNKENLPDNEYKGKFKGKNVFFLQVESLESMVINQKVDGQEITPNINKLVNSGLYFSNIFEQNHGGNTADAEIMSNTSILPLGNALTFMYAPDVKYNSIANVLKTQGYTTMGAHPERAHDYFWSFNYRAMGFDNIYDIDNMNVTGRVGYYVSDEDFFSKYLKEVEKKKDEGPIFSMAVTISSHGPFDISEEYRYMKMPDELYKNRLGEYFQAIHYADKQIGMFIDGLDKMGILQDSVIVVFGDHGGPHKYYPDLIKDAPLEGDWWKKDTSTVPLVIYSQGIEPKVIDKHGGLIDLPPTLLYLLDVKNDYMMGRNLLNTNRDATVYLPRENADGVREKTIVGNVQNEEERKRLEEAYDIGDIIIRTRYLEKQNKLNY